MNIFLRALYYVFFAFLVLTYATHSIRSFIGTPDKYEVLSVFNLDYMSSLLLLLMAGIHDLLVVILLLFKKKIFPKIPILYVYIWAGMWPIVPRLILWAGGYSFEWVEVFIFAALSTISYFLLLKINAIKTL